MCASCCVVLSVSAGEPAPEKITDKIYGETQKISTLKMGEIPDVDLNKVRGRGGALEVLMAVESQVDSASCSFVSQQPGSRVSLHLWCCQSAKYSTVVWLI